MFVYPARLGSLKERQKVVYLSGRARKFKRKAKKKKKKKKKWFIVCLSGRARKLKKGKRFLLFVYPAGLGN